MRIFSLGIAVGVLAAGVSAGRESEKEANAAQATFEKLLREDAAAYGREGAEAADLFVREVRGLGVDKDALFAQLAEAKVRSVAEKGDCAVVAFETAADGEKVRRGVLLRKVGEKWLLDCAGSFVLEGPALDAARGKKPAKASLAMRTDNGPYGQSAYSFTYATGDVQSCKNRADIWFCHNNDFHVRGAIADLGKQALKKADSIPVDAKWSRTARAEPGHTYVVRCGADERRDFFVAFRVARIRRGVAELEWTLLAGGRNAPASIHEAQPLSEKDQRAGSDGTDGLCGKNG